MTQVARRAHDGSSGGGRGSDGRSQTTRACRASLGTVGGTLGGNAVGRGTGALTSGWAAIGSRSRDSKRRSQQLCDKVAAPSSGASGLSQQQLAIGAAIAWHQKKARPGGPSRNPTTSTTPAKRRSTSAV